MNSPDRAPGVRLVTDYPGIRSVTTILPAPVEVVPKVDEGPTPVVLLERDYAGLRVEIGWHPDLGVTLFVQEGEQVGKVCTVEPEKAFDAFDHPFLYLQAAGLA